MPGSPIPRPQRSSAELPWSPYGHWEGLEPSYGFSRNPTVFLESVSPDELELLPNKIEPPGSSQSYHLVRNSLGAGFFGRNISRDTEMDQAVKTFFLDSRVKLHGPSFLAMLQLFALIAKDHGTEVTTQLIAYANEPQLLHVVLPYQAVGRAHCLADLQRPMLDLATGQVIDYFDDRIAVCGSIHSHVKMAPWPSATDDQNELGDPGLHMIVGGIGPATAEITGTIVHNQCRHRFSPALVMPNPIPLQFNWEGIDEQSHVLGLRFEHSPPEAPWLDLWREYVTLPPPPPPRPASPLPFAAPVPASFPGYDEEWVADDDTSKMAEFRRNFKSPQLIGSRFDDNLDHINGSPPSSATADELLDTCSYLEELLNAFAKIHPHLSFALRPLIAQTANTYNQLLNLQGND